MITMKASKTFTVASVLALVAGCGATTETADVAPPEETLTASQSVTSVNADGSWTATANYPNLNLQNRIAASASFTGPSGKTRKMGVCLLEMTSTACTIPSGTNPSTGQPYTAAEKQASINTQCASAPSFLPTGGSRYCMAENGAGQTYCAFRPGSQTSYCAGSPALSGAAVAPGSYTTPRQDADQLVGYISDACFEGCSVVDPSASSAKYNTWDCSASPAFCFKYYPTDPYCGGNCPNGDA